MAPYKRKSDLALVTAETIEYAERKLEAGKSKREGTIPVTLGRFKRALTDNMERALAQHCRDLDFRFCGLTRNHVMKIAFDFAEINGMWNRFNKEKQMAGKDWLKGFCKRNKLSCSLARATGFNKVPVSRFYNNLKDCCLGKNAPAHKKFNVDEPGLSTVPNRTPKVLTSTGKITVCNISSAERGETHTTLHYAAWVQQEFLVQKEGKPTPHCSMLHGNRGNPHHTAVCCMGATCIFVPAVLSFPRKRMNHLLSKGAPSGTLCLVTETGYMNSGLIYRLVEKFCASCETISRRPDLARGRQSLDTLLTSCNFREFSKKPYTTTAPVKLAEKAFEVIGIEPFNTDVINEDLLTPSLVTDQPLNEVSSESANPSNEQPLHEVPA
ncbi:hypothetical protein PR048_032823 [Dryococelus australis]|uniref:HTH CENPB-type domain-containing protein n=1 Tax=Dryococelus australis TaxID=614101 RepID=A0ABQ9G3A0_9NEOP|nr:hypothetical protein PR048_032823 [Dryococelus australis]